MEFLKTQSNEKRMKAMNLIVILVLATMPAAHAEGLTDFLSQNTGIMRIGFGILALFCLNEIMEPFFKGGEIQKPILKILGACAGIGIAISPDTLVSLMQGWGL